MIQIARILTLLGVLILSAAPALAQNSTRCLPTDASCSSTTASDAATRIDPKFRFLAQVLEREGRDSPVFGPDGAPDTVGVDGAAATLRFVDEIPEEMVEALEERGVEFARRDGEVVHLGPVYSAFVEWEAFEFLAEHPLLVRADASWAPLMTAPLETTSETVGAAQAHVLPEMEVDGEGVAVADIDSGFDVLHPHFFRADGGYYDWLDTNENGLFDAAEDSVEVNGTTAVLRVLDSSTIEGRQLTNQDGELQPDSDWLYADMNENGERDVGPVGFAETDPAYGEPLFVVDDVDKNGELAPGERLVRLKTSKFRKIVAGDEEYVRGTNLIDAVQSSAAEQPGHGTGVASILGGGQKGFHRRVGLAPGVDILGYGYGGRSDDGQQPQRAFDRQLGALADAIDEGATLALHEWTYIIWVTYDGSSNVERAMDQARQQGLVQVNPLGNLNQADKHIHRPVEAGETVELEFHVSDGFQYGHDTYPYSAVYLSFYWRADHAPSLQLVDPNGQTHDLELDQQTRAFGDASVYATVERTERDTRHAGIALWRGDRESLVQGDWKLVVDNITADDELSARVSDMYSSWGRGVYWTDATRDYGTVVFPASADSAFGVAAFGGRRTFPNDSEPGELRGYSGRGPTLDGRRSVDIAAPDDPFAALGVTPRYVRAGYGRSWFRPFGGTSGAGPHVAAAVALLKQQNPDWGPDQIEAKLIEAADHAGLSPDMGDYPNTHWGHGKLDIFGALYGIARPAADNAAPHARLEVALDQRVVFDASESTDADGDSLTYRFDFDYDGQWDTGWSSQPSADVDPSFYDEADTGSITGRVEVRDTSGASAGALTTIALDELPDPSPDAGGGGDADVGGDADAGGDAGTVLVVDQPSAQPGGCGCGAGSGAPPVGGLLLVAFVLGSVGLRRRGF